MVGSPDAWVLLVGLLLGVARCQDNPGCGRPTGSLNRIVEGQDARPGEFPWQVSIRRDGVHLCGGSLVAPRWVITAAHCFATCRNASRYQVLLGATQLSNPGPQACCIRVAQVVTNPLYAGEASSGDVALLHLAKAVTFTRYASPICLPGTGARFPPGLKCWVTGWGNFRCCEELPAPQALQKLAVPIIDTGNCSAMYATDAGNRLRPRHIRDDMLCAGYAEGKKDACKGDSGGPLVCPLGSQWALAGIVSWGEGCGVRNRPGVYTRLTAYRDWVRRHIPKLHFMGEPGPARGWGSRSS